MRVRWASKALDDIVRLYEFLELVNPMTAAKTVQSLSAAPDRIAENPRIGVRLDEFEEREVRRLLIGTYEMRYELTYDEIFILRVWHTREER